MRKLVLLLALLLAACGGSQSAPVVSPSAAAPNVKPAASGWQAEWDAAVAGATKEGKLVLSGPPSQVWRTALTSFEKDYPDVKIEYTGTTSRDFWPKIVQEQKAGQYLTDLRVGGPDPQVFQARDEGYLAQVGPTLIRPDVADDSQWIGVDKGLPWGDKAKQYLRNFLAYGSTQIMVNRDSVPASQLSSGKQLTEPQWKGKMVLQDPRGGSGLGSVTTIMVAYGEDFLKKLLSDQALAVTADNRQEAEWLARGRYAVGIGNVSDELLVLQQQGVKANVTLLEDSPPSLSTGFGGIQLMKNPPHPNSTKVFVNWLLGQKAQTTIIQTIPQANSLRKDVTPVNKDTVLDLNRLDQYIPHQYEQLLPQRQRALQLSNELLK